MHLFQIFFLQMTYKNCPESPHSNNGIGYCIPYLGQHLYVLVQTFLLFSIVRNGGCHSCALFVNPANIKSAILGTVSPFIAQVPLAKYTSGIPGCFEGLRQRDRIQAHTLTHKDGMGNTAHKFMATTHEFGTAGRAPGTGMIPR